MSGARLAVSPGSVTASHPRRRRSWHRGLHRSDFIWSAAFAAPYAAMFLAFVVYPIGAALWMARDPSLYATLLSDKHYLQVR